MDVYRRRRLFRKSVGFEVNHSEIRIIYIFNLILNLIDRSSSFQCQRIFQVTAPVNCVCLHPNQAELIVGDQSGVIHLWDLRSDHNEQLVCYLLFYSKIVHLFSRSNTMKDFWTDFGEILTILLILFFHSLLYILNYLLKYLCI